MIILWDLHDVLFYKSRFAWIHTFCKYKKKGTIIRNLTPEILNLLCRFIGNRLFLSKKNVTSEELILQARKDNNNHLIELVEEFSYQYQPNHAVVQIMKTLHKKGYRQDICSNIGPTLLITLQKRYPEIMNLFSYAHIVHFTKEGIPLKKPNPAFFHSYLNKNKTDPQHLIFIDDNEQNIKAAQACGIVHAIQFTNINRLQFDLQKNFSEPLF